LNTIERAGFHKARLHDVGLRDGGREREETSESEREFVHARSVGERTRAFNQERLAP
jgi:hypothetical protein